MNQLTRFIKVFKPELVAIGIDKKENGDAYECDLNLIAATIPLIENLKVPE